MKRVQVSLDSASPLTHDAMRGEGSWRVGRDAIDFARNYDVPVEISATVSGDRVDELEGIAGIAYATGSKVLVRPLQTTGRASMTRPGPPPYGGLSTLRHLFSVKSRGL